MSHLHIPDGVISPFWLVLGFAGTAVLLTLAVMKTGREDAKNNVPRIGIISAFMLLAMSIPLGFLPVHLNLTVLAGILLGPWLGVIAVFVVNLILALVGHGGITVVGLNTLVVGSEAVLGYYLFTALRQKVRPAVAAATATVLALVFSLSLMIGTVGLTQVNPAIALHDHHHHHGEDHQVVEATHPETAGEAHQHEGEVHDEDGLHHGEEISLARFVKIVFSIGLVGIVLEATVIALMVGYLLKVRPDLV